MSFMDNGRDTRGKMLLQSMRVEEGEFHLFFLSDRHVQALLSITEYLRWANRYDFLPDNLSIPNALRSWVDDLEDRLMHPYQEEGNMPINCADVLACIIDALNNNNTFKNQIASQLAPQILNTNNYNTYITNQPIPNPSQPLIEASNNYDVIWAQCVAIVEFVHGRIMQLMAILEVQSNNIELLANAELIPFLGTLMDEIQIDQFIELIDYSLGVWSEQYQANFTDDPPIDENDEEMGTKWHLACALFCDHKVTGEFSVDSVYSSFTSLFTSSLPPSDNIAEIIQFLIGINDDNALVVYGSFIAVWGIAKLTSQLVNSPITNQFLNAILQLAVNDANNDWQLYCFDCVTSNWCFFEDTTVTSSFVELQYNQDGFAYINKFTNGVGFEGDLSGFLDECIVRITLPSPTTITEFSFDINVTGWDSNAGTYLFIDGALIHFAPLPAIAGIQTINYVLQTPILANSIMYGVDRSGSNRTPIGALTAWQAKGEGTNPFGENNC